MSQNGSITGYDSDTDDDYDSDCDVIQATLYNHWYFQLTGSYPKKMKRKNGNSAKKRKTPVKKNRHTGASTVQQIGRWTNDEHERFLQALKLYPKALKRNPKQWKKIAEFVKSRTVLQVRTHAQKFFKKLKCEVTCQGNSNKPPKDARSSAYAGNEPVVSSSSSSATVAVAPTVSKIKRTNEKAPKKMRWNKDAQKVTITVGTCIKYRFRVNGAHFQWFRGEVNSKCTGRTKQGEGWYNVHFDDGQNLRVKMTQKNQNSVWCHDHTTAFFDFDNLQIGKTVQFRLRKEVEGNVHTGVIRNKQKTPSREMVIVARNGKDYRLGIENLVA